MAPEGWNARGTRHSPALPAEAFALLPYLLDPLAPGTRRCVLKGSDSLGDRHARKAAGVYYTPGDLARYMAEAVDASRDRPRLDPACGSGVFLRAAHAAAENGQAPLILFGCDIDPLAAEQCAFVLLALALRASRNAARHGRVWQLSLVST